MNVLSTTLFWFSTVAVIAVAKKSLIVTNGMSDEYPYLVGLATIMENGKINQTVCSGTLVSPNFVLTSAHCTSLLQPRKFKVFSRMWTVRTSKIRARLGVEVFTHESYDASLRLFDLSLVKLARPFKHVNRYAKISQEILNPDLSMNCVVVGIGAPDGHSYQVPVKAMYGKSACEIPKSNPLLKYVIGYTWTNFMCTRTVDPLSPARLPCGKSDLLVCDQNTLYGVFSYGYETDKSSNSVSDRGLKETDTGLLKVCSDPTVQSRSLLVNQYYDWIKNTVSNPEKKTLILTRTTDIRIRGPDTTLTSTPNTTPTTTRVTPTTSRPTSTEDFSGLDEYPYLVYLQGLANEPSCGGTLLSPNHVLTSAYCTTRMSEIHVTAIFHKKLHTNSDLVYVHPDFDEKTLAADVSIVVLREPLNVNEYVNLADITEPSNINNIVVMSCAIMAKTPSAPYYYQEPVKAKYGLKACRRASVPETQTTIYRTWREFICGWSDNRLEYDIGNPLICDGMQYGLISHTYQTMNKQRNNNKQMRLLALKNYKRWIESVVAEPFVKRVKGTGTKNRCSGIAMVIMVMLHLSVFRS